MPGYEKELMVKELKDKFRGAGFLFVTSYKGLNTIEMNELRRKLNSHSAEYLVIKNRIARLALKQTDLSKCTEMVDGSIGLTIGRQFPEVVSKVLFNFAKAHEALVIRGGLAEDELVSADYIKELAVLPSREVLLASVVRSFNAPISGLVNTLSQVIKKFVIVVDKVREKKEGGAK